MIPLDLERLDRDGALAEAEAGLSRARFLGLGAPAGAVDCAVLPVQRFHAAVSRVLRYANLVALPYLRPDRFRMEPGRRSSRRSSCAFNATTTVEADIRIAPTLMGRTNPIGARIPAANGTEMRL